MHFDFANPEFLWILLSLPLIALLRSANGKSGSLIFSSTAIARAASRKNKTIAGFFRFFLTLVILALLIFALARPRLGTGRSERDASGIDIVLTVDSSGSMAGLDFSSEARPVTRFDAVKNVIEEFIKNRPNDRIGMVTFAVNPFLVSPMTLDHDWLLKNIERLDIGIIDPNKTAIGTAIGMSVNRLRDAKNSKSRVIILLTDGENNAGKISPIAAAEAAASHDIKIYTIAAGRRGIVPAARIDSKSRIIRTSNGSPIYGGDMSSEVDEETLKKISDITGGKFFRAHNLTQLRQIYSEIDSLEKTKVKLRSFTSYEELFQYFTVAALALLAIKLVLVNTCFRTLP